MAMADVAALEAEIDRLHAYCERHGLNSRGVSDIVGREFALPVDAEHKATVLQVTTAAQPHMWAFHLAWLGFFSTFFSTFAPAPLMPYIKPALGISKREAAVAGMASVGELYYSRPHLGSILLRAREAVCTTLATCHLGSIAAVGNLSSKIWPLSTPSEDSAPSHSSPRRTPACRLSCQYI